MSPAISPQNAAAGLRPGESPSVQLDEAPRHAGDRVRRLIERIWHIRGTVELAPGQSIDEAFDRLDPLFQQPGTTHERNHDTLTFRKKDPASQDSMAVFNDGVLRIEPTAAGRVLHYRLTSKILLFCFLAPLMFLAFAGMTIGLGKLQEPTTAAEKKAAEAEKAKEEAAKEKLASMPLHPIDRALGAPAPEKPKKDKKDNDAPQPTAAYVFAGLFAFLYAVGRFLEGWLVRALFRKSLADA
ncbi:MAG: hypothetical protein JWM38_1855 [Sphingomonas bacterium]|nr:hypothetical protein [Sphingomonas bacterium]